MDLTKCGVYAYCDSPQFEILLFAYAFDEEETEIIDLACGEHLPQRVLDALEDTSVIKTAFNAAFERTCISKHLGKKLSPVSWQCTAVQSAMLALPLSLDGVGEVLNIKRKKLKEGTDLVRFFSMPCKPTKANGGRTRNLPSDEPEKWERFKAYCIRDVDAEREIRQKLRNFPIPESEMRLYQMDQEINDRGILVDRELVTNAILCDTQYKEAVTARAYELTGLENPNSPAQIKGWLSDRGVEVDSLDKKAVKSMISDAEGEVLEVLRLGSCKQGGFRPVLVVSNNRANEHSPVITIVPLTARVYKKRQLPTHVFIPRWSAGLNKHSMALAEQVETIDKNRLKEYKGCIRDEQIMRRITEALKIQIGAVSGYD